MKLKFSLHGQALKRADRNYIVADSKNFLTAEFDFSHQWNSCEKTAIFKNEYGAYSVLLNEDKCIVPYEVMGGNFGVSVFGVSNELRITTNEIVVELTSSGYTEGETPEEPTPTVYEQILTQIAQSEVGLAEEINIHTENMQNPHCVTKEQLGLGNVDNTADMDKPISVATQAALDLKADKASVENVINELAAVNSSLGETKADKTEVNSSLAVINSDIEALKNNAGVLGEYITSQDVVIAKKADKTEVEALQSSMGDISTALDEIISLQNQYIGGDAQ